ncbi:hypothetical protein B0I35DRAFT_235452 [Stachybotrys elegans]|uniref:Uncharacterized protein n=1 Tax=Stachybotrys elegans TaxID=80388 RepID=A0A8K0WQ90_9HYPO|nr:hypothetical protein B0I35DRAFT_235452 [Stachybotrys elegans]
MRSPPALSLHHAASPRPVSPTPLCPSSPVAFALALAPFCRASPSHVLPFSLLTAVDVCTVCLTPPVRPCGSACTLKPPGHCTHLTGSQCSIVRHVVGLIGCACSQAKSKRRRHINRWPSRAVFIAWPCLTAPRTAGKRFAIHGAQCCPSHGRRNTAPSRAWRSSENEARRLCRHHAMLVPSASYRPANCF